MVYVICHSGIEAISKAPSDEGAVERMRDWGSRCVKKICRWHIFSIRSRQLCCRSIRLVLLALSFYSLPPSRLTPSHLPRQREALVSTLPETSTMPWRIPIMPPKAAYRNFSLFSFLSSLQKAPGCTVRRFLFFTSSPVRSSRSASCRFSARRGRCPPASGGPAAHSPPRP